MEVYCDGDGFLNGDGFYTGSLINVSDQRLKKNVLPENNALSNIMKLKPSTYEMDAPENSNLNLGKGNQHGFIAQQLEEVFPELISTVRKLDKDGKPIEFKGVNYLQLISLLTKAIQEQQEQIETLRGNLEDKEKSILVLNALATGSGITKEITESAFVLSQNVPNPFSSSTKITYIIPVKNTALLAVFDLNGKMLLQFPNLRGEGQVSINGSTLPAGMYLYSLIVAGQEIVTKKMILTR